MASRISIRSASIAAFHVSNRDCTVSIEKPASVLASAIAKKISAAPSSPPAPKQIIEVLPIPRLDANAVSAAAGSRASAMQIRSGSRVNMAAVAADRSGTKQAR